MRGVCLCISYRTRISHPATASTGKIAHGWLICREACYNLWLTGPPGLGGQVLGPAPQPNP